MPPKSNKSSKSSKPSKSANEKLLKNKCEDKAVVEFKSACAKALRAGLSEGGIAMKSLQKKGK
jgi:hypothetical protein